MEGRPRNHWGKAVSDELQELVNRFLAWKLPTDFYPDCHIHFDREKAEKWGPQLWPSGTNLLNADQARAMLEHVTEPLRAQLAAQPRQPLSEWIACSDRLPENDTHCFVVGPRFNDYRRGQYTAEALFIDGQFLSHGEGDDLYEPSHWFPIPTLPAAPERAITGDKP